jgi:hypothetical protein
MTSRSNYAGIEATITMPWWLPHYMKALRLWASCGLPVDVEAVADFIVRHTEIKIESTR